MVRHVACLATRFCLASTTPCSAIWSTHSDRLPDLDREEGGSFSHTWYWSTDGVGEMALYPSRSLPTMPKQPEEALGFSQLSLDLDHGTPPVLDKGGEGQDSELGKKAWSLGRVVLVSGSLDGMSFRT